jgi:hypothetical protein
MCLISINYELTFVNKQSNKCNIQLDWTFLIVEV